MFEVRPPEQLLALPQYLDHLSDGVAKRGRRAEALGGPPPPARSAELPQLPTRRLPHPMLHRRAT